MFISIEKKNVGLGSEKLQNKNDVCWCKFWCNVKQQALKELVDYLYLVFFYKKYLQNLGTTMYQRTSIFYLFLLGIPSSLVLSIKNRGMGGSGLLNGHNLLSMTKVICWWSLKEKIAQTLFEIKNKYIRILKCNLVRLQALWTVCLVVCVSFQFSNDLAIII